MHNTIILIITRKSFNHLSTDAGTHSTHSTTSVSSGTGADTLQYPSDANANYSNHSNHSNHTRIGVVELCQDGPDDPALQELLQEYELQLNTVALFFLKKGFAHVSILDGGFHKALQYVKC